MQMIQFDNTALSMLNPELWENIYIAKKSDIWLRDRL